MKIKVSQLREAIRIAIKDILKESQDRVKRHEDGYGDSMFDEGTDRVKRHEDGYGDDLEEAAGDENDFGDVGQQVRANYGMMDRNKQQSQKMGIKQRPETDFSGLGEAGHKKTSKGALSSAGFEPDESDIKDMEDRLDDEEDAMFPDDLRHAMRMSSDEFKQDKELEKMSGEEPQFVSYDEEDPEHQSPIGEAKLCEDGCLGCVLCQNGPQDHEINHLKDAESNGLSVMATIKSEARKEMPVGSHIDYLSTDDLSDDAPDNFSIGQAGADFYLDRDSEKYPRDVTPEDGPDGEDGHPLKNKLASDYEDDFISSKSVPALHPKADPEKISAARSDVQNALRAKYKSTIGKDVYYRDRNGIGYYRPFEDTKLSRSEVDGLKKKHNPSKSKNKKK